MRQAIHIFRKDLRHCWPYIAAVVGLTAIRACQASLDMPEPQSYRLYTNGFVIACLMALAWWLAIGAAIHGESLVGERQFWTTRPYSWKSLLSAKLLFIAAFLAVPLLISDCIILLASGFNPLDLIPGLLSRQCWFLAFLVLPFVVAMLTRAPQQLALAGILFLLVSYVALNELRSHSTPFLGIVNPEPAWIDAAAPWLAPALALPLIVWQYARRRTVPVLVLAIVCFGLAPALADRWIRFHWSGSPQEDPRYAKVGVRLDADPAEAKPAGTDWQSRYLSGIPVKSSGWPRDLMTRRLLTVDPVWPGRGVVVSSQAVPDSSSRISTASDGRDWLWFSTYDMTLKAEAWGHPARVDVMVNMELDLFERKLSATIHPGRAWTYVPGFGNVKFVEVLGGGYPLCRTALQPADSGWTYSLRDTDNGITMDAAWSVQLFDGPVSPYWFPTIPVNSHAGRFVLLTANPTTGGTTAGFAPVHHDPSQPLIFTAKHQVAKLSRVLIIPKVQLPSLPTRHR